LRDGPVERKRLPITGVPPTPAARPTPWCPDRLP